MGVSLRGMTWDHTRGYLPMVATGQRFHELHPEVDILWDRRSLQAFADYPLDQLIDQYDLLVIDHPWAGQASQKGWLVPLDEYLSPRYLAGQERESVGQSYMSYQFDGHQWALPIDAATPVAAWRPDVFHETGFSKPENWSELLDLAKRGLVILPAKEIDLLMHFYMVVHAIGGELFRDGRVASDQFGLRALTRLRELVQLCPPEVLYWNPIQVYEVMTGQDRYAYCPFAYGYANYAQRGYGRTRLEFGDLVRWDRGDALVSVLGGTGLAISARSPHLKEALAYAEFVGRPETQSSLYAAAGGQPGSRSAWLDEALNESTAQYYRQTLPALDRAYLRPRYPGYLYFQDRAGGIIHAYVKDDGDPADVMEQLNQLYRNSMEGGVR